MGWLKWNGKHGCAVQKQDLDVRSHGTLPGRSKTDAEHVEIAVSPKPHSVRTWYHLQPSATPDHQLPFIHPDIVRASKSDRSRIWIVIDDIVYDCTEFVSTHPGGHTIIESFDGENCSWQFWRFHQRSHLESDGTALRIGRTSGVHNRFKEQPRFVGLRNLGSREDS